MNSLTIEDIEIFYKHFKDIGYYPSAPISLSEEEFRLFQALELIEEAEIQKNKTKNKKRRNNFYYRILICMK